MGILSGLIWMSLINHKGSFKSEGNARTEVERFEDAILLALKMKEGDMNQRM